MLRVVSSYQPSLRDVRTALAVPFRDPVQVGPFEMRRAEARAWERKLLAERREARA